MIVCMIQLQTEKIQLLGSQHANIQKNLDINENSMEIMRLRTKLTAAI